MKYFFIIFLCAALWLSASIRVDPALADDIGTYKNHIVEFYAKSLYNAGAFSTVEEALEASRWECGDQGESQFFTVRDSGSKCGYYAYSINDHSAHLDAIYLEPEFRGKGLGKAILICFEKELEQHNVRDIKLFVFKHNRNAIRCYKQIGYQIFEEYPIGYLMLKPIDLGVKTP